MIQPTEIIRNNSVKIMFKLNNGNMLILESKMCNLQELIVEANHIINKLE